MGVFFHLKNGTTKYASIADGSITLRRFDHMIPKDNYSGYCHNVKKYEISGCLNVWNDKEHVDEVPLTTVYIKAIRDEIPTESLYDILYEQYKQTLYSYEDDI